MYAKLKAKELDVPPLYALQQPNTIDVIRLCSVAMSRIASTEDSLPKHLAN